MRASVSRSNNAELSGWLRKWRKASHRVVILLQVARYTAQLKRMGYPRSYVGQDKPSVYEIVHGTKPARDYGSSCVSQMQSRSAGTFPTAIAASSGPEPAGFGDIPNEDHDEGAMPLLVPLLRRRAATTTRAAEAHHFCSNDNDNDASLADLEGQMLTTTLATAANAHQDAKTPSSNPRSWAGSSPLSHAGSELSSSSSSSSV
jgi:hypothetical protein